MPSVTRSKLTESAVARIKGLLENGTQSRRQLARVWGVGLETINRIAREETWWWVEPEFTDSRIDRLTAELRLPEPLAKDSAAEAAEAAEESLKRLQGLLEVEPVKRVDWIELKSQPIDELMDLTNQGDSDEQIN